MNQQPPSKPFVMDQAHLRRARNRARESGRTVIAELERLNNGTSHELVQQLSRLFGMTAVDREGLHALSPAFDMLPLPLAQRWQCMLFRDASGALSGVLADPFDPDLQLWLNSQARGTLLMRLASTLDLRDYLEAAERSFTAPSATAPDPYDVYDSIEPDGDPVVMEVATDVLRRAMRR